MGRKLIHKENIGREIKTVCNLYFKCGLQRGSSECWGLLSEWEGRSPPLSSVSVEQEEIIWGTGDPYKGSVLFQAEHTQKVWLQSVYFQVFKYYRLWQAELQCVQAHGHTRTLTRKQNLVCESKAKSDHGHTKIKHSPVNQVTWKILRKPRLQITLRI